MRKLLPSIGILIVLMVAFSSTNLVKASHALPAPARSTAYELLDEVNTLRISRGLAPYQANPILMGIAQAHADYMASTGNFGHTGPDGSRPYQRALAAGYAVAGDLSQGGFFSENIAGGTGKTAAAAVENWMGDDPHMNTMLSSNLQDAGAGVGLMGDTYIYVLDAGRSTGGAPFAYTPPANVSQTTPTIVPNTPNPDGSIIHIVRPGDTLGSLSMAYDISVAELLALNNLTLKSVIYVDQKIVIRAVNTPTPTQPTGTPTIRPTSTEWPTITYTSTGLPNPPPPLLRQSCQSRQPGNRSL